MTATCPHCGQSLPERDQVSAKVDELLILCQARRIAIIDGRVREPDAAELLGWSRYTLRNRRLMDAPIPWVQYGRTPMYEIRSLAAYLVNVPNRTFTRDLSRG